MRILSLVLSLIVTLTLATVVLTYLERRVGEQRIYVQDHWLSSEGQAYRSYGDSGPADPDTALSTAIHQTHRH
jgi:hypothetical protein